MPVQLYLAPQDTTSSNLHSVATCRRSPDSKAAKSPKCKSSSIAVELRLERPDFGETEVLGLVVVELSERRFKLGQVEAETDREVRVSKHIFLQICKTRLRNKTRSVRISVFTWRHTRRFSLAGGRPRRGRSGCSAR